MCVVLTHCKHLCDGDYLVDDRAKNGASEFPGEWVQFGSERYPDWEEVTCYLVSEFLLHDEDDEKLNKRLISYTMVEKTIKMLDEYMTLLNQKSKVSCTPELCKKVDSLMKLTNKWLDVKGDASEVEYYVD